MVDFPDPPTLRNTLSTPEQIISVLRVVRHHVNLGKFSQEDGRTISQALVSPDTAQEILDWLKEVNDDDDDSDGGT